MTFPDNEPVVTAASIVALVAAVLGLGIAFGLPVTPVQRDAILVLVAAVAPIAVALAVRPYVTPNVKVAALIHAAPPPHG